MELHILIQKLMKFCHGINKLKHFEILKESENEL